MSLAENLRDLERHAQDFAERRGFTYTVLSTGTGEVIGQCHGLERFRMTGVSGGAPLRVVTVCDVDSGAARRGPGARRSGETGLRCTGLR